jgi:hypothetical protein
MVEPIWDTGVIHTDNLAAVRQRQEKRARAKGPKHLASTRDMSARTRKLTPIVVTKPASRAMVAPPEPDLELLQVRFPPFVDARKPSPRPPLPPAPEGRVSALVNKIRSNMSKVWSR